jgi:ParB family chromosome partitioning protein
MTATNNTEVKRDKSSKGAYGAEAEVKGLSFDPAKLVLVTDPANPLYDARVHLPINEAMVLSIMEHGVKLNVTVYKNPETGDVEVADGRQRIKNAVEANRRLAEMGLPIRYVSGSIIKTVPRLAALETSALMVIANQFRVEETPITRATKMLQQLNLGVNDERVAIMFGCDVQTVRNLVALLESPAAVQDAIDAGEITAAHARHLGKLPPEQQRAAVAEIKAATAGKTGHDKSKAAREVVERVTAKGGAKAPAKVKGKKEILAKIAEFEAHGEAAAVAALKWVMGLDEAAEDAEDGGDEAQDAAAAKAQAKGEQPAAAERDTKTGDMFERTREGAQEPVTKPGHPYPATMAWPFPSGVPH